MSKWIKNTREKPKDYVLVFMPDEPEGERYHVKKYVFPPDDNFLGDWCDSNLDYWVEDGSVSHWMYLPKEPE